MSMTRCQSSIPYDSSGAFGPAMPALLTRIEGVPSKSQVRA